MKESLNKGDRNLLFSLVEYRVLSTAQIALLEGKNPRSVRRLMKRYLDMEFIESIERGFTGSRGRPENLFCLGRKGVDILRENQLFDSLVSYEKIV